MTRLFVLMREEGVRGSVGTGKSRIEVINASCIITREFM